MAENKNTILHIAPEIKTGAGLLITELGLQDKENTHLYITSNELGFEFHKFLNNHRQPFRVDVLHRDIHAFYIAIDDITAIIEATKPTIIHAHNGYTALIAGYLKKKFKDIKIIGTFYSFGLNRPTYMYRQDIDGFNACDIVTTICDHNIMDLKLRGCTTEIRKSPIYLQDNNVSFLKEGKIQTNPIFLTVATIEERKNQLVSIMLFENFMKNTNNPIFPQFLLSGKYDVNDKYYKEIIEYITHKTITNVNLLGYQYDISRLYEISDFYLSTSISEGFGISILEAMQYGVIPVVCQNEGTKEFINEQNAIVVENHNIRLLLEKLLSFYEKNDESEVSNMRYNAYMTAKNYIRNNEYIKYWQKLYYEMEK